MFPKGLCSPDLTDDPASALQVQCTLVLCLNMLEFARFCSQNPDSENDAWLLN